MSGIYQLHMNGDCWLDCPVCEHEKLNPDEGIHPYCETCKAPRVIEDEFDDQIGYEEKARPVHVVALDCGHDIVTELRR